MLYLNILILFFDFEAPLMTLQLLWCCDAHFGRFWCSAKYFNFSSDTLPNSCNTCIFSSCAYLFKYIFTFICIILIPQGHHRFAQETIEIPLSKKTKQMANRTLNFEAKMEKLMTTMQLWEKASHWSRTYSSLNTLTYYLFMCRKIWLISGGEQMQFGLVFW